MEAKSSMILQSFQKRAWAEVDLDAAEYNFKVVRSHLNPKTKLCCVVKANGYGHGAVFLSKLFEALGADYLAVSNIEEAIQIRKAKVCLPILILGYSDPNCAELLARYSITQSVFSYEYGKKLSMYAQKSGVNVKTHIKIDSGMGRIGFRCNEDDLNKAIIVCKMPGLCIEGVFTHFASADEGDGGTEYTVKQYNAFIESISYLEENNLSFQIRHCSNSAGIFDYPNMQLDMVRAGIVLYGLQPSTLLRNSCHLRQLMSVKTVIDQVKIIHSGDCLSYGRDFEAKSDIRVATIPIGYADGLWRSNNTKMMVGFEGKWAPILGRICMDQCMIDISRIPEAVENSVITVYGTKGYNTIDNIAKINSTINYEIVCAIAARVPRVYLKEGKIVGVSDALME